MTSRRFVYKKLVRDGILPSMEAKGEVAVHRTLLTTNTKKD